MSLEQQKTSGPSNTYAWRFSAVTLILVVALLRILYLLFWCPFDLSPDEAHYWDWSRHLDWSYYSKGPLVAFLIHASCWLFGSWSESLSGTMMPAVRLPAVMCSSLLLLSMYVLTAKITRRESIAFTVVAVLATTPLIAVGSVVMTIDSPFTCCWGWALVFAYCAILERKQWAWPMLGVAVGVGFLAKYTMVLFYPALFLFLLFTPAFRRVLAKPGFWMSVGVAIACCSPIIIWNFQNDWVGLFHVRGQAGFQSSGPRIHLFGPLKYVGEQFAVLLGVWFILWLRAVWFAAPWKQQSDALRFLWWTSVPVFVFFGLFAFSNGGGQPNWPVTAYLSGFVLIAVWLPQHLRNAGKFDRRVVQCSVVFIIVFGAMATAYLHRTDVLYNALSGLAAPPGELRRSKMARFDPTFRLRGWQQLASQVDVEIERLRDQGIEPILATDRWNVPGELGFYCRNHPQAYCFGSALGDRHSQYDLWRPNPLADANRFQGQTFIYIGNPQSLLKMGAFQHAEAPKLVVHREKGHLISIWQINVLREFQGFPVESSNRY